MGPKLDANSQQNEQEQKVTDYKSSHRPQGSYGDASSARISKFASGGVLSEGIEEYSLNKQV